MSRKGQQLGKPRPASDQYALGIVVYEWLSGERPFQGSLKEFVAQHLAVPPPPLCATLPTLSPAVEQVMLTALAKDPKDRFASVQAFATALEQAFTAAPTLPAATPTATAQPTLEVPLSFAPTLSASWDKEMDPLVVSAPASFPVPAAAASTPVVPASLSTPQPLPSSAQPTGLSIHRISRRRVLLGLAGLAAVAGGGLTWAALSRGQLLVVLPPAAVDSPMFGFDLQHTHFNPGEHILSPGNVSRLVPYWTVTTGDVIRSSPAVANGVVYVGSDDHKLYAFQAASGQPLWSASTNGPIYSSPAVANGVVYVGSADAKLYAYQADTGQPLSTASLSTITANSSVIRSSPAVANGVVYVGSEDHKLYAFHLP